MNFSTTVFFIFRNWNNILCILLEYSMYTDIFLQFLSMLQNVPKKQFYILCTCRHCRRLYMSMSMKIHSASSRSILSRLFFGPLREPPNLTWRWATWISFIRFSLKPIHWMGGYWEILSQWWNITTYYPNNYPLVNVYITMERSTMLLMGKSTN